MPVRLTFGVLAVVFAGSATAQEGNWMVPVAPPRPATAAAGASGPVLKAGTPVPLKVSDSAKGKALGIGQRIPLTVASDVRLGSQVVIPAGASAEGEITAVEGKTLAGKALYVRVNDKLVRLTGSFNGASGKALLGEDVRPGS